MSLILPIVFPLANEYSSQNGSRTSQSIDRGRKVIPDKNRVSSNWHLGFRKRHELMDGGEGMFQTIPKAKGIDYL